MTTDRGWTALVGMADREAMWISTSIRRDSGVDPGGPVVVNPFRLPGQTRASGYAGVTFACSSSMAAGLDIEGVAALWT